MKQKVEIEAVATESGGWGLILNTTMDLDIYGSPNPKDNNGFGYIRGT